MNQRTETDNLVDLKGLAAFLKKLTVVDSCIPVPLRTQLAHLWLAYTASVDSTEIFAAITWLLDQLRPIANPGAHLVVIAFPPQTAVLVHAVSRLLVAHRTLLLSLANDALHSFVKLAQSDPSANGPLVGECMRGIEQLSSFPSFAIDKDSHGTLVAKVVRPAVLGGEGCLRLDAVRILANLLKHFAFPVDRSAAKAVRKRLLLLLEAKAFAAEERDAVCSLLSLLFSHGEPPLAGDGPRAFLASIRKALSTHPQPLLMEILSAGLAHFDQAAPLLDAVFDFFTAARPALAPEFVTHVVLALHRRCGPEHSAEILAKVRQRAEESLADEPLLGAYMSAWLSLGSAAVLPDEDEIIALCTRFRVSSQATFVVASVLANGMVGRMSTLLHIMDLVFAKLKGDFMEDCTSLDVSAMLVCLQVVLWQFGLQRATCRLGVFYTPSELIRQIRDWVLARLDECLYPDRLLWPLLAVCETAAANTVDLIECSEVLLAKGDSFVSIIHREAVAAPQLVFDAGAIDFVFLIVTSQSANEAFVRKVAPAISRSLECVSEYSGTLDTKAAEPVTKLLLAFEVLLTTTTFETMPALNSAASICLKLLATNAEPQSIPFCRLDIQSRLDAIYTRVMRGMALAAKKYHVSQINLVCVSGPTRRFFAFVAEMLRDLRFPPDHLHDLPFFLESFQKIISPFLSDPDFGLQSKAAMALGRISYLAHDLGFRDSLFKELYDQALHLTNARQRRGYILALAHVFVNGGDRQSVSFDSVTVVGMLSSIGRKSGAAQAAAISALATIVEFGAAMLSNIVIADLVQLCWELFMGASHEDDQFLLAWSTLFVSLLEVIGPDIKSKDNRWRLPCLSQSHALLEMALASPLLLPNALKAAQQILLINQEYPSIDLLFSAIKLVFSAFAGDQQATGLGVSCIRWLFEFNRGIASTVLSTFLLDLIQFVGSRETLLSLAEGGAAAARDTEILLHSAFELTFAAKEFQPQWLDLLRSTFPASKGNQLSKPASPQSQLKFSEEGLLDISDQSRPRQVAIVDEGSVRFVVQLFSRWMKKVSPIDRVLLLATIEGLLSELVRLCMSLVVAPVAFKYHTELKILGLELLQSIFQTFGAIFDSRYGESVLFEFQSQLVTIFNTACADNDLAVRSSAFLALLACFGEACDQMSYFFSNPRIERLLERSLELLKTHLPASRESLLSGLVVVNLAKGWAIAARQHGVDSFKGSDILVGVWCDLVRSTAGDLLSGTISSTLTVAGDRVHVDIDSALQMSRALMRFGVDLEDSLKWNIVVLFLSSRTLFGLLTAVDMVSSPLLRRFFLQNASDVLEWMLSLSDQPILDLVLLMLPEMTDPKQLKLVELLLIQPVPSGAVHAFVAAALEYGRVQPRFAKTIILRTFVDYLERGNFEELRDYLLALKAFALAKLVDSGDFSRLSTVLSASPSPFVLQSLTVLLTTRPEFMFHFPSRVYLDMLLSGLANDPDQALECWLMLVIKTCALKDGNLRKQLLSIFVFPTIPRICRKASDGLATAAESMVLKGLSCMLYSDIDIDDIYIGIGSFVVRMRDRSAHWAKVAETFCAKHALPLNDSKLEPV